MKLFHYHTFIYIFIFCFIYSCAQSKKDSQPADSKAKFEYDSTNVLKIKWKKINKALSICETYAPRQSDVNDSKITILRLSPALFDFHLFMGTEHGNEPLSVSDWADSFDLNIVFNAGMYDLNKPMYSKALMKDEDHANMPKRIMDYKSLIAFNPKDTNDYRFKVFDLDCDSFSSVKSRYHCLAQGMRMLDCNGEPIAWNKRRQLCSQLICAIDDLGYMYLIFVRSPYLHNEMIAYMQQMNLNLYNAIYLEGGPETSLYVHIPTGNNEHFHLEKIGSYVSETYATDTNNHFWKLPNVIGLKLKKMLSV